MSLEAMPVHVKVIRKIFSLTNKCMMRTTINCRFLIKITLQFVPFFRARFHLFFFFYQVPNMHVFCSSGGEEAEAGRITLCFQQEYLRLPKNLMLTLHDLTKKWPKMTSNDLKLKNYRTKTPTKI